MELPATPVTPGDRGTSLLNPQACNVPCFNLSTFACSERAAWHREQLIVFILTAAGASFLLLLIHTAMDGLSIQLQEVGQSTHHQLPASTKGRANKRLYVILEGGLYPTEGLLWFGGLALSLAASPDPPVSLLVDAFVSS